MLKRTQEDANFSKNIVWCDEAKLIKIIIQQKKFLLIEWSNHYVKRNVRFQVKCDFNAIYAIKYNQIIALQFCIEIFNG